MKSQSAINKSSDRAIYLLPTTKKNTLIAKWQLIEGKLTCVWLDNK